MPKTGASKKQEIAGVKKSFPDALKTKATK